MNWPSYAEYKDSEVTWFGEIPKTWAVSRLKFHLERNDGGVWGDDPDGVTDTIVLRSTEQTVDGNWVIEDPAPRKLSIGDARAARLVEDDLLVTKSSGSSLHIGKTTIVSAEVAELVQDSASMQPDLGQTVQSTQTEATQVDADLASELIASGVTTQPVETVIAVLAASRDGASINAAAKGSGINYRTAQRIVQAAAERRQRQLVAVG
jgi:hypothetical protein